MVVKNKSTRLKARWTAVVLGARATCLSLIHYDNPDFKQELSNSVTYLLSIVLLLPAEFAELLPALCFQPISYSTQTGVVRGLKEVHQNAVSSVAVCCTKVPGHTLQSVSNFTTTQ